MKTIVQLMIAKVVLTVFLVSTLGCDECMEFEQFCSGNKIRTCQWISPEHRYEWQEEDCGDLYCVDQIMQFESEIATCVQDAQPEPACEHKESGRVCLGAQLIQCRYGYFSSVLEDCGAADLCQSDIGECLFAPGKSDKCPIDKYLQHCIDNQVVRCEDEYLVLFKNCAESSCVEYEQTVPQAKEADCVESDVPDDTCRQLYQQGRNIEYGDNSDYFRGLYQQYCDQDMLIYCFGEYVHTREDCDRNNGTCESEIGYYGESDANCTW